MKQKQYPTDLFRYLSIAGVIVVVALWAAAVFFPDRQALLLASLIGIGAIAVFWALSKQ